MEVSIWFREPHIDDVPKYILDQPEPRGSRTLQEEVQTDPLQVGTKYKKEFLKGLRWYVSTM